MIEQYIETKLITASKMTHGEFIEKYKSNYLVPQCEEWLNEEGYAILDENNISRSIVPRWVPTEEFEGLKLDINMDLKTMSPSVSEEMVKNFIVAYDISTSHDKITIVVATLANGFTIVESSACVSPKNYSEKLGAEICKKKIENKVWSYLGFLLQTGVTGVHKIDR